MSSTLTTRVRTIVRPAQCSSQLTSFLAPPRRNSIDGLPFQLVCNNGENALHGGPTGFHTRQWSLDHLLGADGTPLPSTSETVPSGVQLSLVSADGEEGYPGELHAKVTYLLHRHSGESANEPHPALKTAFEATVVGVPTVVNLAQHAYWNLGGHDSGDATQTHVLRLHAARFTPVSESLIPTGDLAPADWPFNFAQAKLLSDGLAAVPSGRGFDHNFVLDGPHAMRSATTTPRCPPSIAAELFHQASGRCMRLFTDAPGVQLYAGGFLDNERGKAGAVYQRHGGICLETQIFPDAINQPGFPSPILRPGERYVHTMVTQFFTQ